MISQHPGNVCVIQPFDPRRIMRVHHLRATCPSILATVSLSAPAASQHTRRCSETSSRWLASSADARSCHSWDATLLTAPRSRLPPQHALDEQPPVAAVTLQRATGRAERHIRKARHIERDLLKQLHHVRRERNHREDSVGIDHIWPEHHRVTYVHAGVPKQLVNT